MIQYFLKRVQHHLYNGGWRAVAQAGVRTWHRNKARKEVPVIITDLVRDALQRKPVVVIGARALDDCLGMHPAAMVYEAAHRSGRTACYINWKDTAERNRLDGLLKDAEPIDVFVFTAEKQRAEISRLFAGKQAELHFDGIAGDKGVGALRRPAILATTAVVDEYVLTPSTPKGSAPTTVLVPLIDLSAPEVFAALRRLKSQGVPIIVAAAASVIEKVPAEFNAKAIASTQDLVKMMWRADVVLPDFASRDVSVRQTVTGAAAFLKRVVLHVDAAPWDDYPLSVDSPDRIEEALGRKSDRLAEAQLDVYIAAHDAMAQLDRPAAHFEKSVSIVVLTHNNKAIIGRFLETLKLHCADYLCDVIVVDNASRDGSAEHVETNYPWATLIRNPLNGCSSGRNIGVKASTGKYVAFFDSDQWFVSGSGFFEALTLLDREPSIGAIGWNAGWFDKTRTDFGGVISDHAPRRGMNKRAQEVGYRTDIGFLGTSGFFTHAELWNKIPGFDEFYDPTCFEDTDLSFQIKAIGQECAFRDLSGVRHQPHQTTKASAGSDAYQQLYKRNGDYFRQKWLNNPDFFVDYEWNTP